MQQYYQVYLGSELIDRCASPSDWVSDFRQAGQWLNTRQFRTDNGKTYTFVKE